MRMILAIVLASIAFAQSGAVRGRTVDPSGVDLPSAIRLLRADGSVVREIDKGISGEFEIPLVPVGSYVLSVKAPGFRQTVRAFSQNTERDTDLGRISIPLAGCLEPGINCFYVSTGGDAAREPDPPPIRVLTICEALQLHDVLHQHRMVVIGILDGDRLRGNCDLRLRTGPFFWPNEIRLEGGVTTPKDYAWDETAVRNAALKIRHNPNERIVALFGRFAPPAGILNATDGPAGMIELHFTLVPLFHDRASIRELK